MKIIKNYIDGQWHDPVDGQYLDNKNPATGEVYSKIPDSNVKDVEKAVKAAQKSFNEWKNTPAEKRSEYMLKIAARIQERLDELALAETNDNGKPLNLSKKVDIPRASANFKFYATGILHLQNESYFMEKTAVNYTLHQPVGIAGCISPWNLPLYLFTWKIAPALATGCTVVAKPSEITPMTAFMLSEIAMECGLPPGVLNIVHGTGPGVGEPIVAHPLVKAVSFTGGTSTGRKIASIAAPMFKKLSLELGGKNPSIVFADADFDKALKGTILAAFSNQGQICLCGSRLYVEKPVYEKFKEAFVEKASQLRVGDPLENETQVGALVSESHMNKVLAYIELAQREGGKILCGGERIKLQGRCANGYFVAPTVIEGLSINCRTNQEEIFGPVVTIEPFETIDELLDKANGVEYGLAANLWTQDINKALYVSEHLEAGIVWVNTWLLRDLRTPFGGMKNSGVGREGGFEALKFFTEPKNVCIKYY